jgi:hypothetical protein
MRGESREPFVRNVRRATWYALGALGAVALVAPGVARAAVVVLTATIGIAHGATDAATLDRFGVRPRGGKTTISIAYGVLATVVYALAYRRPAASARLLRIVSWAHFGSGDAAFARACGSRRFEPAEAFVRGAVPLSIGGRGSRSAVTLLGACAYAALDVLFDEVPDAIDIVLPAVVLYAAPARLGFGAYFAAWHAPRHLALLLSRDPRGGTYRARLARFAREAAPNAAIAAAFGAVAYYLRGAKDRAEDRVGAIILGITIPHQIAVWTIEFASRREGVRYS